MKTVQGIIPNTTAYPVYQGNLASDLQGYAGYIDTGETYVDYSNNPLDYRPTPEHVADIPNVADIYGPVSPIINHSAGLAIPPTAVPVTVSPSRLSRVKGTVGDWLQRQRDAIKNNPTVQQAGNNWKNASLFDKTQATLGAVGSVVNAYNAYKANKLANKQFAHAVDVHNKNWDAQRKQTNSQLEDRQKRRVEEAAANGRTTTSVSDYMAKYGV